MAASAAGSASSMAWSIVGSTVSEPWSDIEVAQIEGSKTDGPDIVASFESVSESFDFVEDFDAMAESAMALESTTQTSSKVTDWVEQQALEDRAPDTSDAPNPVGTMTKPTSAGILGLRRYDIVTLLQLRYTSNLANVELRIHPSALQEQIFKPTPCNLFTRTQHRSRGLSDVSLNSARSPLRDEEFMHRKPRPTRQPIAPPLNFNEALQLNFVNRFPRRQPCSPPSSSLAQQHDGFARFLKEHASPPHQRVTAGGRIVPAAGPPPIFNVDSLRGPTPGSGTQELSTTPQQLHQGSIAEDRFRHTAAAAANNGLSNAPENDRPELLRSSRAQQAVVGVQADGSKRSLKDAQLQSQVGSAPQIPYGSNSFMLADGSSVITQNGYPYRVYWNGFQTVTEPMIVPFAAVPGSMPATLQPTGFTPQYSIANPYANTAMVPLAVFNTVNGQDFRPSQPDQQLPDHALERLQETLKSELQKLDKHIAMRSHMFSALEHNSYIAQRKHLVEQMDCIRVRHRSGTRSSSNTMATDQVHRYPNSNALTHGYNAPHRVGMQIDPASQDPRVMGIPAKFDAYGSLTGPPWNALVNGDTKAASATAPSKGPQQRTPPPKKGLGASSILSPDAPPFIPSSMQKTTARKVETCFLEDQRQKDLANVAIPSSVKTPQVSYGAPLVVDKTQKPVSTLGVEKDSQTTYQDFSNDLRSHGRSRISGSGSAMYDLVPLVHHADIAYVDILGLNPMPDCKLYCSTIIDFQEVIRRVREQARLYGCKGGQSKDPEFDAEQDIRWAMADSSPIPLPKKLPDHIAYPRPWNWNDSAFNVRADRSDLRSRKSTAPTTHVGKAESQTEDLKAGAYKNEGSNGQLVQETDLRAIASVGSNPITYTSPASGANPELKNPISESTELESSAIPRIVLGDLSPNKQATVATSDSGSDEASVSAAEPAPKIVLENPEMLLRRLFKERLADWEKSGPIPFFTDDTPGQRGTINPAWVENSALELEKRRSIRTGAQTGIQEMSAENWTKANQDAVSADNVPFGPPPTPEGWKVRPIRPELHTKTPCDDVRSKSEAESEEEDQDAVDADVVPFLPPPIPEGWKYKPIPPEVLSKLPWVDATQTGPPKDPQVHFPNGQQYRHSTMEANETVASSSGFRPLGYNEHKPLSIPTGSMSTAPHAFLRGMLKTSRFSPNSLGQQKSTEPVTGRNVSFGDASSLPTNKENVRSSMRSSSQASYAGNHLVGKSNAYHSSQAARLSKAHSLVAPSSQHAQGYLPQYQGLGNLQSSDYYVRYHTPQPYGKLQGGYVGSSRPDVAPYSSRHYPPQYDGGADSPPRLTKDHSGGANGIDGMKGAELDPQAFSIDNGKLPAGHSYAVDRLFQAIREAERKEKDKNVQKAPKRA